MPKTGTIRVPIGWQIHKPSLGNHRQPTDCDVTDHPVSATRDSKEGRITTWDNLGLTQKSFSSA
jgi:hypothetical protein